MKILYAISLSLSLFLTASTAFAQTNPKPNISGVILDENKKPADYVTVVLFKSADSSIVKTAFTDPNGTFGFTVTNKGSYFYKASNMGYKTFKSKIIVLTEDNQKVDFGSAQLVATAQNLKE